MQDLLVEKVQQMLGVPIFEGQNEILLLGKALTFGVIFQKYELKLIKIWKNYWKNSRKKSKLFPIFLIFARQYGKIMNIVWLGYKGGGVERISKFFRKWTCKI